MKLKRREQSPADTAWLQLRKQTKIAVDRTETLNSHFVRGQMKQITTAAQFDRGAASIFAELNGPTGADVHDQACAVLAAMHYEDEDDSPNVWLPFNSVGLQILGDRPFLARNIGGVGIVLAQYESVGDTDIAVHSQTIDVSRASFNKVDGEIQRYTESIASFVASDASNLCSSRVQISLSKD